MPISRKQLLRLIRLVALLKENRYPNCASFCAELRKADLEENLNLACSEKTVYRDIQILKNDFGAPIRFDAAQNGYYLTHHRWIFSCPQFSDDSEMFAAVLGARLAEHIFPPEIQKQIRDAVDYLLTCNNPEFLNQTQINSLIVIPSNRTKIDAGIFMPLFRAWQAHEVCRITYQDSNGKITERDFEPHTLIFYDGVWYSKGFCRERKQMRTLVLLRMKVVIPTGQYFIPDLKIIKTANEETIFDPKMVEGIRIICDGYLANILRSRPLHQEQKITATEAGNYEVYIPIMSEYRLITWVMHQCGRATLLSPEDVAEKIIAFSDKITTNQVKGAASNEIACRN